MNGTPNPANFRRGDELHIRVKFASHTLLRDKALSVNIGERDQTVNILIRPSDVVKHIPRAIEVGDKVKGNTHIGEVKAVCGQFAWVLFSGTEQPMTRDFASLTRVEPTDDRT